MANLYNLKRFDLNLLIIFECIYQNLSISQAAQTLFITPSAVSQSLQRLRVQLDDPLFVRAGKGITPTNVAINLHQHLAGNLDSLEETINMMSHSTLNKRFVVYGPQLYANNNFQRFMDVLLNTPNLEIEYYDTANVTDSIEDLMHYRRADIFFTTQIISNRTLVCQPFVDIDCTMVCRKDHPRIGSCATIEDIKNERFAQIETSDHIVTNFQKDHSNPFISNRKIAFRTSSLVSTINIVRHSDLLGIVPKGSYELLSDAFYLKEVSIPAQLPRLSINMVYSRASLNSQSFSDIINKSQEFM